MEKSLSSRRYINLIVPAAGLATRLRPLSSTVSKTMVRVHGKPTIDYIIESALKCNAIAQIVIVDGELPDIRTYVTRRWSEHVPVSFVRQEILSGPRDAIALGLPLLQNPALPLCVWLGDSIVLEQQDLACDALFVTTPTDQTMWCIWDGRDFYDKPEQPVPDGVALVGVYCFADGAAAKTAFSEANGYDISDALRLYPHGYTAIHTDRWYDIGDIANYYKTCAALLNWKTRHFNRIDYDATLNVLQKFPQPNNVHAMSSIRDECAWYEALNWKQSMFVPRYVPTEHCLTLSYESGTLLSDLLLYDDLPTSTWYYILRKLVHIMQTYFHDTEVPLQMQQEFRADARYMWSIKTRQRLNEITVDCAYDGAAMRDEADTIAATVRPIFGMHGDLHLGNVLYNATNDKLTLIDPRGRYGKQQGTYGDNLYDYAKLAQDLYWGYSHVVANKEYKRMDEMRKLFRDVCPGDVHMAITAGRILMATAVPLHADDPERQRRMLESTRLT